ncbi:MAG: membrane protein insertion efficiency factor YidD [Planctomycetes bacterium]|nr:membrane protein insertion efficiency factor YidD [Planctomycetota bacterium]
MLVGIIRIYQGVASPVVGKVVRCKFQPTCSHYGAASIMKYGTILGSLRTLGRLWRCSPWGPPPGEDLP